MSLLDAYEEGTLQTAKAMDAAPLPEPVPEPKHSAWTVLPRALAGAALEVAGNLVDVGSMIGQVVEGETRDYGDFEPLNTRPEASRPHYEMAREMRPDPLTAGLAENVIFGVGKGLTKAAFAVTAGGVIPGAAAFGLSEGMTTSEDLAEQGVDAATRQKVGTVTGVVSGASVILPVAGTSLLKTAGLVAAGGPAAYIAQETIIKDILEEADYQKIADQHDPLDPVGLAVSTLLPAAFGAMAMRGAFKGKATQEELDAAMVHNTTMKADQFEAETPQAVEAMKQAEESVQAAKPIYEHTGPVGKAITERLMGLGTDPKEAADKGLLWDSFFKSMEARTGQPADELMGRYFDRVFKAEDVPEGVMGQGKAYGFDQIQTPEFKAWSGDAPFVPKEEANTKTFKTGEPVVVEAYHGTSRPDRVGETFKKSRATSGPMAFHTSNPELASGYAQGKNDTSLALEDQNYSNWFKFKPKGERSPIDIERAWHRLDPETKAKIEEIAPTLRQDEDGNVISEPGNTSGNGSYDYNLSETRRGYDKRGNPLKALVEDWLNSGVLFDDEEKFMQVLQQAGFPVKDVTYDSPHAQYPFVYKNFIRMKNPLVTDDIPQSVFDALNAAAKRDRSRAQQYGADMWDKNTKTLKEWVQFLNDPSTQQHAWTSIPDKVTKILKELGYDGIIDESGKNGGEKHPVYIPFEESQVKSAIGNKGTFSRDTSNILKQSAPIWYSQLSKTIADAPEKVFGSAKQVKDWLNSNASKLGVKKDEIDATGILDWLETQGKNKVSKADIAAYLEQGGVKVQEVMLSDAEKDITDSLRPENADKPVPASTKYSDRVLPGGENYRELLLTLPAKVPEHEFASIAQMKNFLVNNPRSDLEGLSDLDKFKALNKERRKAGEQPKAFQSSHFDQPNIIAHVRFNERIDAEGRRVCFLEEVQADKGQMWRKLKAKIENGTATESDKAEFAKLDAMPFNETKAWTALALKRMIRYAADNGFDRIAWTNGEQQAARYDLSKQLSAIEYKRFKDGHGFLIADDKNGETVIRNQQVTDETLEDYVGKEVAKLLLESEPIDYGATQSHVLTGLDLKVGGEGMKGFYDQIIPQVANDVLKKLGGGKVGDVKIGDAEAAKYSVILPNGKEVHTSDSMKNAEAVAKTFDGAKVRENQTSMSQPGFDITPALREKVMGGMPLFQGDRGFLQLGSKMSIGLLSSADKSTFLHESGHFFLEVMNDLSKEVPDLQSDMDTVHQWMGIKGDTPEARSQAWNAMTLEEKRPFHEQWARGFEQYLMEGKAPTSALKEAFARFRDWLIEIYKSAEALNVTLSDDVRKVMDRMLTVKESEPRQVPASEGVPPPRVSVGEVPAGNSDLDQALASGEPQLATQRPLDDPDLQAMIQDMAENETGWAERGGFLLRSGSEVAGEETISRTKWIPKAEWWPDRPAQGKKRLNEAEVSEAIRKHIAGEPLKPLEQRTVEYMGMIANDRLNSMNMLGEEEFAHTMDDVAAESIEPTTEKVFDSQAVGRARELNPEAAMQAIERYDVHDDDAIFMAEIRSILDESKQQSIENASDIGQDTGKETDPVQSEAERIAAENPERRIPIGTDQDGNPLTVSVREYLDEARAQADQARQDVNLIKAAAECLLGQL